MSKKTTCDGCPSVELCIQNNTCASHKTQLIKCCELCDCPLSCENEGMCLVFLARFDEQTANG